MPRGSTGLSPGLWTRTKRTVELVRVLGPRELRVRYRQSALDASWALISPVVILAVYGYVLTQSFDVSAACSPYLVSAWSGLVVWTFFSTAVGGAVASLISSAGLITKLYFPREAIPLSVVLAALTELVIGFVTLVVLMAIQGVHFRVAAFAVVLPLLVVVLWTAATAIFVAVWAAFARDTIHAVALVLRVGFFFSPVMYEASFLPDALAWTSSWNPLAVGIAGVRATMLCGEAPAMGVTLAHLAAGAVLLGGAVWYTRSVESRLADVV